MGTWVRIFKTSLP